MTFSKVKRDGRQQGAQIHACVCQGRGRRAESNAVGSPLGVSLESGGQGRGWGGTELMRLFWFTRFSSTSHQELG